MLLINYDTLTLILATNNEYWKTFHAHKPPRNQDYDLAFWGSRHEQWKCQ